MIPYHNLDEIILLKAYRSKSGEVLYGQRLDGIRSKCGFFDDEHFFNYWFVLGVDQRITLLDSQMTPMDAADLDNTGRSGVGVSYLRAGKTEMGTSCSMTTFPKERHLSGPITESSLHRQELRFPKPPVATGRRGSSAADGGRYRPRAAPGGQTRTHITSEWPQQSGHFSNGIKSRPTLQTIRRPHE